MNAHNPALAVAAAWLAFMAGLLAGGDVADAVSFVFGPAGHGVINIAGP